jgi:hypothetical protein
VGFSSGAKHKRVLLSNITTADPSSVSPLIERAPVQDVQKSSDGEEATLGKAGALAYSDSPPIEIVWHQRPLFKVKNGSRRMLSFILEVLFYVDHGRCEGSAFAPTTVCAFYDDISSQPARKFHHRKHRLLLLPPPVRLFPCRVPGYPLTIDFSTNEHPLTATKTRTHLRRRVIKVRRRIVAHDVIQVRQVSPSLED